MKKIVCEICESTNIMKKNGVYVCQSCGTQFSLDEVKKMMVEVPNNADVPNTVDVSGSTVIVDTSQELENLYKIARRAKDDNNAETAAKYYDMILMKDSDSWEAYFYTVYFKASVCKIADIKSAADSVKNCIASTLRLIKNNITNNDEQIKNVKEIAGRCTSIGNKMYNNAVNTYNNINPQIKSNYVQEKVDRCISIANIFYTLGDSIDSIFGQCTPLILAKVDAWKKGVDIHYSLMPNLVNKQPNREKILQYAEKIKIYDSFYETPKFGGCYVATAVYGSYDCPEVWTLRRYRDDTLSKTFYGRFFIHTYYAISPTLVKWFGNKEWFKKMWKPKLDNMVEKLNKSGVENTPYDDKIW